ncbi:MAG: hypothetical protein K6B46_03045 [Opitutales bacterium]|nr:hypothetical protein [Opitutales bacterium]
MNEIPSFNRGEVLTAEKLNALADAVVRLERKSRIDVGPGLTMISGDSGTSISFPRGDCCRFDGRGSVFFFRL